MSASPLSRQATECKGIPINKTIYRHVNELPDVYSSTPGGTLYSTTPGGTKIVYEKGFLINLRNSPISKTPPAYNIPDGLIKGHNWPARQKKHITNSPPKHVDDGDQFHMEL